MSLSRPPGLEGTGHPDDNWSALHRRFRVKGRIGWKEGDCPTGGYDLDKALIRATRRMSADYLLAHATDVLHGGGLSFDAASRALGYEDTADFCNKVVLPANAQVEYMALTGIARALGEDIRVMVLTSFR